MNITGTRSWRSASFFLSLSISLFLFLFFVISLPLSQTNESILSLSLSLTLNHPDIAGHGDFSEYMRRSDVIHGRRQCVVNLFS